MRGRGQINLLNGEALIGSAKATHVNWSSIGASEFVSLFTRNQMFGFVLDDVTAPGLLALIAVPSPQRALALRGSLELLMLSTRSVSSSSYVGPNKSE